ncbi:tannase/feruloyl esterase family alpha/beta hydrolase [Sphingobium nicotianae]|uniref:Tannase/feruloyl esterase family alpha/beta hydrolase n=1 Tax=Sphingobium nicotianae TaxID=2782607 RepID=A0A9X1IPK2_9SPHN|nr:tannase/feruloyl esterase family alpha/beta hydrolase [Sphingobium nicotianae]MBT2185986.1 tannase/feruloyl esterase family alpha/beta hydrolase [Sphingobium nicotianae]
MRKAWLIGLFASTLAAGLAAAPASAQQSGDEERCKAAAAGTVFGDAKADARWVGPDAAAGLPGYCEVKGTLSPVAGSNIGVVFRLPADWNGKLLGIGGGGWAGNVTLAAAAQGLKAGYATAQTDGGHPSPEPWTNDWVTNSEAATDFAWRAISRMTVAGKALVRSYYGRAQSRAYFNGCSTGGRMALMEAQRFPADYDGIIAGAPVYSLQVQSSAILRNNGFARAGFTEAQLKLVNASVLKACDGKDGALDGIIAQPRACAWQPTVLACKPGRAGANCLSAAQVATLRTMYAGIRAPDGSYAQLPLSKGGELGWSRFINVAGTGNNQANGGGMPGLAPVLFGTRAVDFNKLDPMTDVPEARASTFAKAYEATDPDLTAFFAHGGKLLLWHGESDPGPSPVGTLDYARAVQKGDAAGAAANMRTYMLPGVEHCRGGPGADTVDWLATLDQWVDKGQAPATLTATKADSPMTRPVCAWPQVAQRTGKGDVNDPKSWRCVAGAKQ